VSWSEHHITRPVTLYLICVLTFLSILRQSLLVVINYSDKPFGLVSKIMLLETNISLKGLEESSSSVFAIVH